MGKGYSNIHLYSGLNQARFDRALCGVLGIEAAEVVSLHCPMQSINQDKYSFIMTR
jgi:hypothetical protein